MKIARFPRLLAAAATAATLAFPAGAARADSFEAEFDKVFGKEQRAPRELPSTVRPFVAPAAPGFDGLGGGLEATVAALANGAQGRIGVAALDLGTGRSISILGDQPFPMASTSKIAIAATYLDLVDQGKLSLSDQFPLMIPQRSARFSSTVAPVRPGARLSAQGLIELAITRSDNPATDALLAAVGGPAAVNRWIHKAGLSGMRLDRDIATLVRDDGEFNPATTVDLRDSATPQAMVQLLAGLYQGRWLSRSSRAVLIGAMERCVTGKRRLPGMLPENTRIAHKTGTLSNTSSDVGIIHTPDGRAIAIAVYVTGQGGKPNREHRIASIARAVYDGYQLESSSLRRTASR
ncbi:MAG: class A beta-lactamase [Novosphingobium sp.]|nr:class A beta-lactamase [Novosphingobium sp.]